MHVAGHARNMRLMEPIWRTLTRDDASALAELTMAAEAVDDEGESWSVEDFEEEFDGPSVDPVDGGIGAFLDGRLVAAGILYARTAADPEHRIFAWGTVHPEFRRRGLGRALLDWATPAGARITERRFPGAPALLQIVAHDQAVEKQALLKSCGYTEFRYDFYMRLSLAERDSPRARIPDGLALVRYDEALSEEFRETHNTAFVPDHPGSTVQTVESWARVAGTASQSFRQDLSFGLRDESTGLLAGYVIGRYYEADTAATGKRDLHLDYIGTRREFRGRGVASALIHAAADAAAAQGFDTASLGVIADNPTGALSVYQRAGFTVHRKFIVFTKPTSLG